MFREVAPVDHSNLKTYWAVCIKVCIKVRGDTFDS